MLRHSKKSFTLFPKPKRKRWSDKNKELVHSLTLNKSFFTTATYKPLFNTLSTHNSSLTPNFVNYKIKLSCCCSSNFLIPLSSLTQSPIITKKQYFSSDCYPLSSCSFAYSSRSSFYSRSSFHSRSSFSFASVSPSSPSLALLNSQNSFSSLNSKRRLSFFSSSLKTKNYIHNTTYVMSHSTQPSSDPTSSSTEENSNSEESDSKSKSSDSNPKPNQELLWETLEYIGLAIAVCCLYSACLDHVFEFSLCQGPSMLPTLNDHGDILLVDHLSKRWRDYRVGDVVILQSVSDPRPSSTVCKRIIALEKQIVTTDSAMYNSEERIGERHKISAAAALDDDIEPENIEIKIPKGHIWIEGDNKHNSKDSRTFGPVPLALVSGRIVAKIWPLHEIKWM